MCPPKRSDNLASALSIAGGSLLTQWQVRGRPRCHDTWPLDMARHDCCDPNLDWLEYQQCESWANNEASQAARIRELGRSIHCWKAAAVARWWSEGAMNSGVWKSSSLMFTPPREPWAEMSTPYTSSDSSSCTRLLLGQRSWANDNMAGNYKARNYKARKEITFAVSQRVQQYKFKQNAFRYKNCWM